jgi:hypothetical protein
MNTNAEILQSIKELIAIAPDNWADQVAAKMKKSKDSVWYYANGKRGLKKGRHRDVLRLLTEVIKQDRKDALRLIAEAQLAKGIPDEDQPEETTI